MENFHGFEDIFSRFLSEKHQEIEKFAGFVERGFGKLLVRVDKTTGNLRNDFKVGESRVFEFHSGFVFCVSEKEHASLQIMSGGLLNELFITYEDAFVFFEGPCRSPQCKLPFKSVIIENGDIFGVGKFFLLMKIHDSDELSVLNVFIYSDFSGPGKSFQIIKNINNELKFNENICTEVIIGRQSSPTTIKLKDHEVSRSHLKIITKKSWILENISTTQPSFKYLHNEKSLKLETNSQDFLLSEECEIFFFNTQLFLYQI
jgi:hypothetical protein